MASVVARPRGPWGFVFASKHRWRPGAVYPSIKLAHRVLDFHKKLASEIPTTPS